MLINPYSRLLTLSMLKTAESLICGKLYNFLPKKIILQQKPPLLIDFYPFSLACITYLYSFLPYFCRPILTKKKYANHSEYS